MGTSPGSEHRGNLRWALLLAGAVLALWFVGLPVLGGVVRDDRPDRAMFALAAVTILLAPVALVWVVGEAHLRWSPRARGARGVVGWTLALACLGLLLWLAPPALYLLVSSLAVVFG
ncbi:hypothetical protein [Knoellia aerolata]|nr:hypothetical protein [Knoellia aerolata]